MALGASRIAILTWVLTSASAGATQPTQPCHVKVEESLFPEAAGSSLVRSFMARGWGKPTLMRLCAYENGTVYLTFETPPPDQGWGDSAQVMVIVPFKDGVFTAQGKKILSGDFPEQVAALWRRKSTRAFIEMVGVKRVQITRRPDDWVANVESMRTRPPGMRFAFDNRLFVLDGKVFSMDFWDPRLIAKLDDFVPGLTKSCHVEPGAMRVRYSNGKCNLDPN